MRKDSIKTIIVIIQAILLLVDIVCEVPILCVPICMLTVIYYMLGGCE